MWWKAVLWSFFAGVAGTAAGALIPVSIKGKGQKALSALLAFTAGFMISVVFIDVLPAANEAGNMWYMLAFTLVGAAIVAGAGVLIDNRIKAHELHSEEKENALIAPEQPSLVCRAAGKGSKDIYIGLSLVVALVLHNIPEGMAVGTMEAESGAAVMAILIALHNIPEGLAICAIFTRGGVKKAAAVAIAASTGIATVIGAVIGYFVSNVSQIFMCICLALSAGAMLYIVFDDMLAEAYEKLKSRAVALCVIAGVAAGALIMMLAE